MAEKTTLNPQSTVLPYAWVILVVVFLASLAGPINQSKVPPLMPVIMDAFQLSIGQAGWLMSVFALTGLLLALPAGVLLQRFGPKKLGLVALICLIIGGVMGAMSKDYGILLLSRVIEGSGMGLIAVVAPASIAMWFPREKQGMPMGIWATWVPVGTLFIFILAPAMTVASGWQSVWWLGTIFSFVVLVLYAVFMRTPPWMFEPALENSKISIGKHLESSRMALRNRSIWGLGLVFACYTVTSMGLRTYYPTFLSEVRDYSLSQAAYIASIVTVTMLFSAPLAGWLSDRIGSRRLVFSIPFLIISVILFFLFKVIDWQIILFLILLGFTAGAIPTAVFAAAPEIMNKPELAGLGMAVVMFGQNLGFFIGPIYFGYMIENMGWVIAGYALIPFSILAFTAGWRLKVR